ncbi:MAG: thioredoxin family protein [Brevinema sp.]
MAMFDEATTQQLSSILEGMIHPVKIIFFKGDNEKSIETETFVNEFAGFSSKITLITYNISEHQDKAKEWNAFATPAIFVTAEDEALKGVGFYGTPGGYEINSFLMSLLEVSGKIEELSADYQAKIKQVVKPLHIYAYISLTCPQCPQAVMNIHKLAIKNPNIKSYMVEGPAFKEYSEKFEVTAFPTIVIGDSDQRLIGENAKDLNQLIGLL